MSSSRLLSQAQINKSSFLRFLLVGGAATLLHYVIMWCMVYFSSISVSTSSATGYTLSTLFNYLANSRFTFGGGHSHQRSLPRFLFVAIIGLGINQIVLLIGIYFSLQIFIAQLAATAFVMFWNYFINAIWTFSRKDRKL